MDDILSLINEMVSHGVPQDRAFAIAAAFVHIGAKTAPQRRETVDTVIDVQLRRYGTQGMTRQ